MQGRTYWMHKVQRGETLYSIARAYGVTQLAIMESNGMTRETVKARQTLLIPQSGTTPDPTKPQIQPPVPVEQPQPTEEPATGNEGWTIHLPGLEFGSPQSEIPAEEIVYAREMKEYDRNRPMEIVVMLPLNPVNTSRNENFSDFYKGILIGLNALKKEGISANVQFLSTSNSLDIIADHIRNGKLEKANLIIGPVYAEAFEAVATYAGKQGIPIVSPLGAVEVSDNPYVFEIAPPQQTMYDKIFTMLGDRSDAERNVLLIDHLEKPDREIQLVMSDRLTRNGVPSVSYTSVRNRSSEMDSRMRAQLDMNKENIVYIPVHDPTAVGEILSRLASINAQNRYRITVVGTPRWSRLNLELELVFKMNAHYPTNYHADRSDPRVARFYNEYIEAFAALPTPYSFRAYDVVRYFAGALGRYGNSFPQRLGGYLPELLQVSYQFDPVVSGGKYRNSNWTVVNLTPSFHILIK